MGAVTGYRPPMHGRSMEILYNYKLGTDYVWQSGKQAPADDGLQHSASENRLSYLRLLNNTTYPGLTVLEC